MLTPGKPPVNDDATVLAAVLIAVFGILIAMALYNKIGY